MEFLNDNHLLIIAGLVSFLITYVLIPSVIKVSQIKKLNDEPDGRKLHSTPVPVLGGLAIFAGISISTLLFAGYVSFSQMPYIIAAVIILFFVGMKDDILIIAPLTKLSGQLLSGFVIVFFTDLKFTNFHGFFGIFEINSYVSFCVTLFVIIVIINSINLIDGIDGLASGIGILISSFYGIWFYLTGHIGDAIISIVVIASMLAFWRFNLFSKSKKIFMGDTGSLILGLLIAVQTIHFNEYNIKHNFEYAKWGAPAVSIGLLIIPLFDTARVMFIRFFLKLPVFRRPDKRHIHHLFLRAGLNSRTTLLVILFINFIFAATLFMWHNIVGIRTWLLIILLAAMFIFYIPVIFIRKAGSGKPEAGRIEKSFESERRKPEIN